MSALSKELYMLSATQALALIRTNRISVQDYAKALLDRVRERDPQVRAWVFLNESLVLEQAKKLDERPQDQRGPLHGVAVGIKDIFLTRDMPTRYYSRLHAEDGNAAADSAVVSLFRGAGALIFGKTATTEFAAMTEGGPCTNPHNPKHTPGGSSSGSAAAVADFQVPLSVGTQTGGSIVRPGSFNGIYGFKPTWGTLSTEGVGRFSISADTPGFYARTVEDLELLAGVFRLDDHTPDPLPPLSIDGAKIAFIKTHVWPNAGPGTQTAWEQARELLAAKGARIEDVELPEMFAKCSHWREVVVAEEARAAFLPKYREDKTKLHAEIVSLVENTKLPSREALLEAHDGIASLRSQWDQIASNYDIILTPSAVDDAPEGLEFTGFALFCVLWTILHAPAMNVPGFAGGNGLPVGLTVVGPRYNDMEVLRAGKIVGDVFNQSRGLR